MDQHETAIAVFPDHQAAENAVKSLTEAGFEMKNLSVVGKGYHSEEKVRASTTWATASSSGAPAALSGADSGGFFFGGLFLTIPVVGHVVVLGYLAAVVV